MTPEALAAFTARLEHWRIAYGLHEWRLVVQEDAEQVHCLVTPDIQYLRAVVRVSPSFPEKDMEACAQHEMAHVLLAEFSAWAATVLQYVGERASDPLHDAWELAWERTTERVARLLTGGAA